jgi:hypothetical protein
VNVASLLRGVLGFVLGGVMSVFMPPLAFAIALVLGGLMAWARLRHLDEQPMTALAAGFVIAVATYVGLAILAAIA